MRLHRMILLLVVFTLSFIVIEYAGLFSDQRPPLRALLMFWVVLSLSLVILLLLFLSAVKNRRRMQRTHWLGLISIALMVSGLRISRFTDFGIDVVLTKGQVYMTDKNRSGGLLGNLDEAHKAMTAPITVLGAYALLAPPGSWQEGSNRVFLPLFLKQGVS